MINCGIDRCPEYLVILTSCCQNRCIGKVRGFKRPVHMVSACLTGGVIYTIHGWVSKGLKPQDKDPLRFHKPVPEAHRLGAGPWLGKIRESRQKA